MKKSISIFMVLTLILGLSIVCGCNTVKGSFYTLKEAYENEWLSTSDLQNIAYYYHMHTMQEDKISSDFTAQPLTPETLEDKIVAGIKKTYREENDIPISKMKLINLAAYYGTYNGCVAIEISDTYFQCDLLFIPEYEVGGVTFYNYCPNRQKLWREDNIG